MIVFCIEVTLNPSLEIFYTHLRVSGGARLEIVGDNRGGQEKYWGGEATTFVLL